jgi:Dolichyl-phosphate-mannose-protein mannosyltransferase
VTLRGRWGITFAVVGVAGIALRVWAYRATLGTPNADEAVVGLMTRHILHGELPTFYWGQAYGGSQEAFLTAPFFAIAGSSWLALRLIPIVLGALTCLVVWRVGRRTIGEPAAAVAGALFWIWPPFIVYQLTHQNGFYGSNVLYCSLLLLFALLVAEAPTPARVGLFGLVIGLAFWQTPQIVPVLAGVIAWTVWKQRRSLRELWVAVPLAALGAFPWIFWNARHGWESLALGAYGDKLHSLRLLASPVLPMMAGLRAPFSAELLLPSALTYLAYVSLTAAFVYGALKNRRTNASLLYLVPVLFPLVYVISPKTSFAVSSPRFVVVLTPVFALLLAQLARSYARAVALLAIACAVSVLTLDRMDDWFRAKPAPFTRVDQLGPRHTVQLVPRDLDQLVRVLDRLGLDHVYTDYWLAYRLDFDTRERITAVESNFTDVQFVDGQAVPVGQQDVRRPEYDREVRQVRHAFVFYKQTVGSVPYLEELERHGYRPHPTARYVVYALP